MTELDSSTTVVENYNKGMKILLNSKIMSKSNNAAEAVAGEINELEIFYEAAGGVNREGEIFGLSSAAPEYYNDKYVARNSARASSSSSFGASSSGSEINEIRTTLQTVQQRLDGFNSQRTNFMTQLQQVTEQQERLTERQERLNEGIHLRASASDVEQLQERMTEFETNIRPAISKLQSTLNDLQATVERSNERYWLRNNTCLGNAWCSCNYGGQEYGSWEKC